MKGPFSIMSFFGITLWIDVGTHMVKRDKEKRVDPYNPIREISVIVPIHSEPFEYIEETIKGLYGEKYPIKNVIICGDSESKEVKAKINSVLGNYDSLYYIRAPVQSKAKKINFIIQNHSNLLGEFVYIRDCRVVGLNNCIEKMISCFVDESVAAVTSYGRVRKPSNFLSRSYFYGKDWVNEIGRFRKNAQEKRKAVFVICGASTIFRRKILSSIPMPVKSKTEDTYYTWILQEKGFKIMVADNTMVTAPDVDGKNLDGIKGQVRQSFRWTSGTMQCMYNEGRKLLKNKRLFYTTILPGFMEAVSYSIPLVLIPLIFLLSYKFAIGFLIGDMVFSLIGTLVIMPRRFITTLVHYPQIFFFKYINSMIFIASLIIVTKQALTGKIQTWSNEWNPPLTKGVMKKALKNAQ
ncbi:Glycosyl transferase family 2 [uncultured archaeon]|nr:Glycosyl transferase family 2 [uncultured archaeon]